MAEELMQMCNENSVSIDFVNFIAEVDAPARKSNDALIRIAVAFKVTLPHMPLHSGTISHLSCQRNDIDDHMDLIGANFDEMTTNGLGLSAGLKGYMRRAIEKANSR